MLARPLHIASVNLQKRSVATHGLLQKSDFDIILIQEPWYGKINTIKNDEDPHGTEVMGTTHNDMWECFLPLHPPDDVCKVSAYVKADLARSAFIWNRTDLPLASPTCLVLDLVFETEVLRLINVYHRVPDKGHDLHRLFSFDLDPAVSSVVIGDFNTHSPTWSLPSTDPSPWVAHLERWFEANDLHLLNPPDVATWDGRQDCRPSIIDLALFNEAAILSDQLSPVTVSFADSLGSDHAALSFEWTPVMAIPAVPRECLPGFAIDDGLAESWQGAFTKKWGPVITDLPSLRVAAARLTEDITEVCGQLFEPRKTPDPRGVRWWTPECSAALALVQTSDRSSRSQMVRAFRHTLADARRSWADSFLHLTTLPKLWQAT